MTRIYCVASQAFVSSMSHGVNIHVQHATVEVYVIHFSHTYQVLCLRKLVSGPAS